ncbi:uncharacterized protein BXIN_0412 [Babesia sp. Xinjiang]|uniref:uncharacterized protein n=1 Tax=Babesia sp. Xinjiang TaxID=462227 RepID=UPI000A21DFA0|nr:uncharacterized protein BXIN_0412 [Babesia sp. Xinjiang]ORM41079.1 hypothetical protein BXIN_0412 [Babesia sp. Xinjiang]
MTAAVASAQASPSTGTKKNSLLDSPENLKEAIDWILRVTNKDGRNDGTKDLAEALKQLLTEVPGQLSKDPKKSSYNIRDVLTAVIQALGRGGISSYGGSSASRLIDQLSDSLAAFIGYKNESGNGWRLGENGIACTQTCVENTKKAADEAVEKAKIYSAKKKPKPAQISKFEEYKDCLCPTIVQCKGVLPLFYRYGFTYYSPVSLNGKHVSDNTDDLKTLKRKCLVFSYQLQEVINDGLFDELLQTINIFIYHIREPFLFYLLTFWLVVIAYLTYGLLLPLDLLHIRSHWKLEYTYRVLPISLFTNKALAPSKMWYFKP